MKCSGVPVNLKRLAQGAQVASNAEQGAHSAQTDSEHMPVRSIGNEEVESSILSRSTRNLPDLAISSDDANGSLAEPVAD